MTNDEYLQKKAALDKQITDTLETVRELQARSKELEDFRYGLLWGTLQDGDVNRIQGWLSHPRNNPAPTDPIIRLINHHCASQVALKQALNVLENGVKPRMSGWKTLDKLVPPAISKIKEVLLG